MPVTKDHSRHLADLMDAVVDAAQKAPWTCQVCDAAQSGPLTDGCVSCGAGTAVARKAPVEATAAPWSDERAVRRVQHRVAESTGAQADLRAYQAVVQWLQEHPMGQPVDAYLAGYQQAMQDAQATMLRLSDTPKEMLDYMTPPAVTTEPTESIASVMERHGYPQPPPSPEVGSLSPEGKASRTIRAALALFRDQVLAESPEEILTGEWCSSDEVTDLINAYAQKE